MQTDEPDPTKSRSQRRRLTRALAFHEIRKVRPIGHQRRHAGLQQAVRPRTRCARHWPRNCSHCSAQFRGTMRHRQRARAESGLDKNRRRRERRHQACPSDEAMSGWNSTWRNLADQHPNTGHAVEKLAVPSRVRPVNPVGENGDGIAAGCESSLMCNSFDPVGTPGNDN